MFAALTACSNCRRRMWPRSIDLKSVWVCCSWWDLTSSRSVCRHAWPASSELSCSVSPVSVCSIGPLGDRGTTGTADDWSTLSKSHWMAASLTFKPSLSYCTCAVLSFPFSASSKRNLKIRLRCLILWSGHIKKQELFWIFWQSYCKSSMSRFSRKFSSKTSSYSAVSRAEIDLERGLTSISGSHCVVFSSIFGFTEMKWRNEMKKVFLDNFGQNPGINRELGHAPNLNINKL